MRTQNERILDYLKAGHKLTAFEALNHFDCLRVASRISEIRKMGINVKSEKIKIATGKWISQYSI